MQLQEEDFWIKKFDLQQDPTHKQAAFRNELTTIKVMNSKQTNEKYKLIKYSLPLIALNANHQKLGNELCIYNTVEGNTPKIKFVAINRKQQEIIIARKTNESEESLVSILDKHQNKDFPYFMSLAQAILTEIQLLHSKRIVHNNLSLETIYLYKQQLRLEPPLFRWIQKNQRLISGNISFDPYLAPELRNMNSPSAETDIFSLGVIFIQLLSGRFIQINDTITESSQLLFNKIESIENQRIRLLLTAMISKIPFLRPSLKEMKDTFKGSIFQSKQPQEEMQKIFSLDFFSSSLSIKQNLPTLQVGMNNLLFNKNWVYQQGNWKIEFKSTKENVILINLQLKESKTNYCCLINHKRILNYLEAQYAKVRLNEDGCIEIMVFAKYQKLIGVEKNEKMIRKYLSQVQEQQVETFSSTLRKIKEEMHLMEKQLKTDHCLQPITFQLSVQIWEDIGDQLFGLCKYDEAINIYQKIIEHNPFEDIEIDGLGNISDQYSCYQDRVYQWYIQNRLKGKIRGSPYDALSLCYSINRKFQEGADWYKNMIKTYSNNYRFYYGLANLQYNRFNIVEAEANYKKVIELKPDFDKPYQEISFIYYYRKQDQLSKQIYSQWAQKAFQLNPRNLYAEVLIAAGKASSKEKLQALEEILSRNEDSILCKLQVAMKCKDIAPIQKNIEKGINILKECIALYPKYHCLYHNIAFLMSKDMFGRYTQQQIITLYRKSIQLNPYDFVSYNNIACSLKDKYNEQLKYFEEIIRINPYFEIGHFNLAHTNLSLKRYDKALQGFQKTLKFNPNYVSALYWMGRIYYQLNDDKKAMECLQTSIDRLPQFSALSYEQLGIIHMSYYQYHNALGCFSKCIQLLPEQKNAYKLRGECNTKLGRYHQAIKEYLKCNALGSNQADIRKELSNLYQKIGNLQESSKWKSSSSS